MNIEEININNNCLQKDVEIINNLISDLKIYKIPYLLEAINSCKSYLIAIEKEIKE